MVIHNIFFHLTTHTLFTRSYIHASCNHPSTRCNVRAGLLKHLYVRDGAVLAHDEGLRMKSVRRWVTWAALPLLIAAGLTSAAMPEAASAAPACTTTITGTHPTQLAVTSGVTCLTNATQNGHVTVSAGAALVVTSST